MSTSTHAFKLAAKAVVDRLELPGLTVFGQRRKPINLAAHDKFALIYASQLSGRGSESGPPIQMTKTERVVIELAVKGAGDEAHEAGLDALVDKIIDELMIAPEIWSTAFPFNVKSVSELNGSFGEIKEGEAFFLVFTGEVAFEHEEVFQEPDWPLLTAIVGRKETGHGVDTTGDGDPNFEFNHNLQE